MSLVSFSDNFAQISLYQKCQLQLRSILANLNNTMQTKQLAYNEKTKLNKNKQDLLGTIVLLVEEGSFAENVKNLHFFLFKKLELYSIYLYF